MTLESLRSLEFSLLMRSKRRSRTRDPEGRGRQCEEDSVREAGGHVGQGQPEELGVPAGRVTRAGVHGGDGVLHAADHLHQVGVHQHLHPLGHHVHSCKKDLGGFRGKRLVWKSKCVVMFGDFKEETATSSGYILDRYLVYLI